MNWWCWSAFLVMQIFLFWCGFFSLGCRCISTWWTYKKTVKNVLKSNMPVDIFPKNVEEALTLDIKSSNNLWADETSKEMTNVRVVLEVIPDGKWISIGHQLYNVIWCLMLKWKISGITQACDRRPLDQGSGYYNIGQCILQRGSKNCPGNWHPQWSWGYVWWYLECLCASTSYKKDALGPDFGKDAKTDFTDW